VPESHQSDTEVGLCHGLLVEAFGVCHGECERVERLVSRQMIVGQGYNLKVRRQRAESKELRYSGLGSRKRDGRRYS
jgi:hypothetical protein